MGHITSYPATLRQIDLSHNEITCWPSLPRIREYDPHMQCYQTNAGVFTPEVNLYDSKSTSLRSKVLKNVCRHRKHLR